MAALPRVRHRRRPVNPRRSKPKKYGKPLPIDQVYQITTELQSAEARFIWENAMDVADDTGLMVVYKSSPLLSNKNAWDFKELEGDLKTEWEVHRAQELPQKNQGCLEVLKEGETQSGSFHDVFGSMKEDLNDQQKELNHKLDVGEISRDDYVKNSVDNLFYSRRYNNQNAAVGWIYNHDYSQKGLNNLCKTGGVTGWIQASVDQAELAKGGYGDGVINNQIIFGPAGYTANWHTEHLNLGSINIQGDSNGIKIFFCVPVNQKEAMESAILEIIDQVCMRIIHFVLVCTGNNDCLHRQTGMW